MPIRHWSEIPIVIERRRSSGANGAIPQNHLTSSATWGRSAVSWWSARWKERGNTAPAPMNESADLTEVRYGRGDDRLSHRPPGAAPGPL